MILAILAAATVTFHPPAPRVGDLITIRFPAPVVLDASNDYEVVSVAGRQVTVRTFAPKPFVMSGIYGGNVRFHDLRIPVRSVLKPKDDMKPAPFAPPRPVPYPRRPFLIIAGAAVLAILAWTGLWWRVRRRIPTAVPRLDPVERFRRVVASLRLNPSRPRRWAILADETRLFLAATQQLGSDLTTREVVKCLSERLSECLSERLDVRPTETTDGADTVEVILRQGDLEKFSRRGAEAMSFDELADRALRLARPTPVEEASA